MVSVEDAVIARMMRSGQKFEILVDPELSMQVKAGKDVSVDDLLAFPGVYEDSNKGLTAGDDVVNKAFGTNDIKTIAYKIIQDGDVQLTTEQRNEMAARKKTAVAALIAKAAVNPKTNAPHPQDRIVRAMDEAKVRIDLGKKAEEQLDDVVKAISSIIPISFEKLTIGILIPAEFAAQGSGVIRNFAKPNKEEWGSDGSYICKVQLPAASKEDLIDKLNGLTRGEVQIKLIDRMDSQ